MHQNLQQGDMRSRPNWKLKWYSEREHTILASETTFISPNTWRHDIKSLTINRCLGAVNFGNSLTGCIHMWYLCMWHMVATIIRVFSQTSLRDRNIHWHGTSNCHNCCTHCIQLMIEIPSKTFVFWAAWSPEDTISHCLAPLLKTRERNTPTDDAG